jgi:hypothetical protein
MLMPVSPLRMKATLLVPTLLNNLDLLNRLI